MLPDLTARSVSNLTAGAERCAARIPIQFVVDWYHLIHREGKNDGST